MQNFNVTQATYLNINVGHSEFTLFPSQFMNYFKLTLFSHSLVPGEADIMRNGPLQLYPNLTVPRTGEGVEMAFSLYW